MGLGLLGMASDELRLSGSGLTAIGLEPARTPKSAQAALVEAHPEPAYELTGNFSA